MKLCMPKDPCSNAKDYGDVSHVAQMNIPGACCFEN